MGESGGLTLLVGVVAVAIVLQCAAATVHVVGGDVDWRIPPNASVYTNWASSTTFHVNDILTFNFTTGEHDVLEVQKASYDACTSTNAIGATITTGPANVTVNSTGEHYYICTFGQHCVSGQKLAIIVSASTSATAPSGSPPPTTTPPATTPPPPPPPPPGSSSSAVFASFFVTLLLIAMGFFL